MALGGDWFAVIPLLVPRTVSRAVPGVDTAVDAAPHTLASDRA
jgi:hypothetical protein